MKLESNINVNSHDLTVALQKLKTDKNNPPYGFLGVYKNYELGKFSLKIMYVCISDNNKLKFGITASKFSIESNLTLDSTEEEILHFLYNNFENSYNLHKIKSNLANTLI